MMQDLYQLTKEYEFLLSKDEYDNEDMQRLEALPFSIEEKIIEKCKVLKLLEQKSDVINKVISEFRDKLDKINKKIDKINEEVKLSMEISNTTEISSCPYFDINIRYNPPSVEDYNPKIIPSEYWRKKEVITLDKRLIQDHIMNGKNIPGARLVKKLRLEIK